MIDAYVVMRVFMTTYGDTLTIPLDAYSTREEAQRDIDNWNRTGAGLMECRLILIEKDGATDSGMSLQDFLESVGVRSIQHKLLHKRVHAKFVDPDSIKTIGNA